MATAEAALERLCDPAAEVSAHYLIAEDGRVWALVDEDRRAWHAGRGAWGDCGDMNSRSIGVELANPGDVPFPAPQMAALETVLRAMLARWAIPPERVIGHACMAPERKQDPSGRFDWRALARSGLSVWADTPAAAGPPDPAAFADAARAFGYPPAAPDALLAAFRRRFRPGATGPLEARDVATLVALASRWPARRG